MGLKCPCLKSRLKLPAYNSIVTARDLNNLQKLLQTVILVLSYAKVLALNRMLPLSVNEAFEMYKQTYSLRCPSLERKKFDDELVLIDESAGLLNISLAPMQKVPFAMAPKSMNEGKDTKFLWVILLNDLPIALENGSNRQCLSRGYLSHTNLTGGAEAFAGGELWFQSGSAIVINGASSRYRPRELGELELVGKSLKNWVHPTKAYFV